MQNNTQKTIMMTPQSVWTIEKLANEEGMSFALICRRLIDNIIKGKSKEEIIALAFPETKK